MKKFGLLLLVGMLALGMVLPVSVLADDDVELTGTLTIWSWGAGDEARARERAVDVRQGRLFLLI